MCIPNSTMKFDSGRGLADFGSILELLTSPHDFRSGIPGFAKVLRGAEELGSGVIEPTKPIGYIDARIVHVRAVDDALDTPITTIESRIGACEW